MQKLFPLFSDIYGQEEAIDAFKELLNEIKLQHIYKLYNEYPTRGLILAGPKGVGKTSMVRALSNELEVSKIKSSLFHLSYIDIANSYLDRPIQNLKAAFTFIEDLTKTGHVIIFIDEIDVMFPAFTDHTHEQDKKRVNIFLEWLDGGIKSVNNITVIGATNEIKAIHNSVLRPGRIDRVIDFKALKGEDVFKAIQSHLSYANTGLKLDFHYNDIKNLIDSGYNGADAKLISSRLIKHFIKKHIDILEDNKIPFTDIEKALELKPELVVDKDLFKDIIIATKPSENRKARPIGFVN